VLAAAAPSGFPFDSFDVEMTAAPTTMLMQISPQASLVARVRVSKFNAC
jgi:hypothetical protein